MNMEWDRLCDCGISHNFNWAWINMVLCICYCTCRRPSKVRCMVTHLLGCAPFVVMAVMRESSSSFFSFSFLTRLSMARLAKLSLSPPCRWHIRLCTMLRQASLLVGVFVIDILLLRLQPRGGFPVVSSTLLSVEVMEWNDCRSNAALRSKTVQTVQWIKTTSGLDDR